MSMEIHTNAQIDALERSDIILLPHWRAVEERPNAKLLDALRNAHKRAALIVGLCLGGYVLAYADLLTGKRASTHWELEQDFTQHFAASITRYQCIIC